MLDAAAALLKHSPLSSAAHAPQLLPALLSACAAPDWGARRAAADALHALVAHHPGVAEAHQRRVGDALQQLRGDKHRTVR